MSSLFSLIELIKLINTTMSVNLGLNKYIAPEGQTCHSTGLFRVPIKNAVKSPLFSESEQALFQALLLKHFRWNNSNKKKIAQKSICCSASPELLLTGDSEGTHMDTRSRAEQKNKLVLARRYMKEANMSLFDIFKLNKARNGTRRA